MNTVVRMDVQADPNEARAGRVAARHAHLLATDAQYRKAMPLESIGELKKNFALRSANLMASVMEAYAERPAVGRRAFRIVTDAASWTALPAAARQLRNTDLSRAVVGGSRAREPLGAR